MMSTNNDARMANEYVMTDWALAGVPGRSYSGLATWEIGNKQINVRDNRTGQLHTLLILFSKPRYDKPFHGVIRVGFPDEGGEVVVQYSVMSTPDPTHPPGNSFLCFDGEMTLHIEFDSVTETGRTYGSFNGNAHSAAAEEPGIYALEGTFDVVYPRPGRTPIPGVAGKIRSWWRRLFGQ